MREVSFLQKNTSKWREFERLMDDSEKGHDPNRLCDLFVELTDDLSYAQTYYPKSKTTQYLNALSAKVHQRLYRNKREKASRLITFWTEEFPLCIYEARSYLMVSLVIVLVSAGLGVLSLQYDERFARLVLGDAYVNKTEANIQSGDAMAIYKSGDGWDMFFMIALNNQMVALRIFVFGVFGGLGTVIVLFQNGLMVGVFQYMFAKQGVLVESIRGIWLHGTLEISGMIIEGAAGLALGTSVLFPGSYTRLESFKRGSKLGIKIMVGLFPQVIAAAALESFVTRFCNHLPAVSWAVIAGSVVFVVWYYIIYPIRVQRKHTHFVTAIEHWEG